MRVNDALQNGFKWLGEFTKMKGRINMKIIVIGGSGLIGSKLVNKLQEHGQKR